MKWLRSVRASTPRIAAFADWAYWELLNHGRRVAVNTRTRRFVGSVALLVLLLLGLWSLEIWRRGNASEPQAADVRPSSFDPFSLRSDHDQNASGQPHLALHDPVHWGRSEKPE